MKKICSIALVFFTIVCMSSCSIDDSNDLDILIPNDTIQTGKVRPQQAI